MVFLVKMSVFLFLSDETYFCWFIVNSPLVNLRASYLVAEINERHFKRTALKGMTFASYVVESFFPTLFSVLFKSEL